jgi:hypothetical protein
MSVLFLKRWYRILQAHREWTLFHAIRCTLWLTR